MKQLIIVRHAKSSWANLGMSDFERPLNERGSRDAPEMANRLINRNVVVDAFVSSTANRALTTATYFAKTFGKKQTDIITVPELYHASATTFYQVVKKLNNAFQTVALFSHNPGITDFVNELTETNIDNMPTCGIFAVKIDTNNWMEFTHATKTFWFVDYPKL
ncbi:MAG: SixA phosphatase family protein [Sediminibacterium sp.]|jgi:phosphohistidine phosphatase|nr:histidine phosphatase family protein [Chitinophagaceae bacterium]